MNTIRAIPFRSANVAAPRRRAQRGAAAMCRAAAARASGPRDSDRLRGRRRDPWRDPATCAGSLTLVFALSARSKPGSRLRRSSAASTESGFASSTARPASSGSPEVRLSSATRSEGHHLVEAGAAKPLADLPLDARGSGRGRVLPRRSPGAWRNRIVAGEARRSPRSGRLRSADRSDATGRHHTPRAWPCPDTVAPRARSGRSISPILKRRAEERVDPRGRKRIGGRARRPGARGSRMPRATWPPAVARIKLGDPVERRHRPRGIDAALEAIRRLGLMSRAAAPCAARSRA